MNMREMICRVEEAKMLASEAEAWLTCADGISGSRLVSLCRLAQESSRHAREALSRLEAAIDEKLMEGPRILQEQAEVAER